MELNDSHREILEMIEYSKQGVLSKEIFKKDELNCSLFCMSAGTEISEHTSTKRGIIYVLEGKGIFNLEGKNINMERGVIINMDRDAVHSLKAKENISFILMLF